MNFSQPQKYAKIRKKQYFIDCKIKVLTKSTRSKTETVSETPKSENNCQQKKQSTDMIQQ